MGEEFSTLTYQINCMSRNVSEMQANEVLRLMSKIVNKVLGDNYKMVRGTPTPIMPLPSDTTVYQLSLRYSCVFDIERNIIYKD